MNSREVLQAFHYESFLDDYENTFIQINKAES